MARGEITQDERHLLARLDRAFAHQRNLDPAVLASVRAWQKTDRTYELVQLFLRGQLTGLLDATQLSEIHTVRQDLDLAVRSGCLPFPLRVFRGLRDVEVSLGFAPDRMPGRRIDLSGFCATTVFRRVALDDFTARRGVLLDFVLPRGTPALWVAGVGDSDLRWQGELLLGFGTKLDVYSHVRSIGSIPILLGKGVAP